MNADLQLLRHAIVRQIFCQRSGVVLDLRSAVLVTVTKGDARSSIVVAGPAWDLIAEHTTAEMEEIGATVSIIDGRRFTAKGEPRKPVSLVKAGPSAPVVVPQRLEQ